MRKRRPKGLVVAIDGPAGAGKSTLAHGLAARLGYVYLDTGAMYRAIAFLAREAGIDPDDAERLKALAAAAAISFEVARDGRQRVAVGGRDVTEAIRTPEISQWASKVSTHPGVRQQLVARQREIGADGGVVAEGRDVGTVVFPQADVKVFLDASPAERARRRHLEIEASGEPVDLQATTAEIAERDRRDRSRAHSPLRPAADAVVLDASSASAVEVLAFVLERCRKALGRGETA